MCHPANLSHLIIFICTSGVCLVLNESGGDSAKVKRLPNQTTSYGLFQVK